MQPQNSDFNSYMGTLKKMAPKCDIGGEKFNTLAGILVFILA